MNKLTNRITKKSAVSAIILLILLICTHYIFTKEDYVKQNIELSKKPALANNIDTNSRSNTNEEKNKKVDPNEGEYIRLTDLQYLSASNTAYDKIRINQTDDNGTKISVKMEGAYYPFDYGIWAHATSNLYYDISEYSEKYHYLTMYIGLNQTSNRGNGVKVWIYTSDNDKFVASGNSNWQQKNIEEDTNRVILPGQEAVFEKVDIRGAKYIRIQAYDNGGNASDHTVYVNPMLITDKYEEEENEFPDISVYDQKIKDYPNKDLSDPKYELLVLQRKFVNSVGNYALKRFTEEAEENVETIEWLMNDLENLRYYILGGEPTGGYYSSLKELTRLLKKYKSDFDISDTISAQGIQILENKHSNQPRTKGNLYKRMAITLSLTHSSKIALWMQPGAPENQSDSVTRYVLYKQLYDEGKFRVNSTTDVTPWFETYTIEEMRYVLHTLIDDEEILWLNDYVQYKIDTEPGRAWLTPHPHMAYVWPNYSNDIYYDDENLEYFNDLFKTGDKKLYDYDITRGTKDHKVYKLWMNFRNKFGTGAVCGGISKSGHCIRGVNGIPSAVIGQPGHAALLYYTKNSNGQGYWGIDNDVSGWIYSEKGERLPLGWGNDRSYVKGYNVPYVVLAQEALNNYESLQKAEELLMTVDTYSETPSKQEEICREAIKAQKINLDAWHKLIEIYNADSSKTEEDYYNLAKEMMEALKCFPFTMSNLADTIKPHFTSDVYNFKFTLLQTRILTEGKNYNGTEVLQPSLTKGLAAYLLGQMDTELATFSFDGEDAGKIKLGSKFDGNTVRWDYSLDGKENWNELSTGADGTKNEIQLTPEQISSITPENDIYVHIVGVNYSEENLYKIDILESAELPANLYANDNENILAGATNATEWKFNEDDEWTRFDEQIPDLSGDKTLIVRMGATGTRITGKTIRTFTFTKNEEEDPTRKRIPSMKLSIHAFSSQATGTNQNGNATYAIDGNPNTRWHSAWNGSDRDKYLTIKLAEPKYVTALDFEPSGGGNGKIESAQILVSLDGENWTEVVEGTDWKYKNTNDVTTKTIDFEPTLAQYVKIVGKKTQSASASNSFIAAKEFVLYEDTTKLPPEENPEDPGQIVNPDDEDKTPEEIEGSGDNSEAGDENAPDRFESLTYSIQGSTIQGIAPNTTVKTFTRHIITNQSMTFKDKDGKELNENSILGTGMTVEVGGKTTYTLIVRGDLDGDGQDTVNDLARIKLHYLEKITLEECERIAADVDIDGEITVSDIAKIKLVMLDIETL